MSASETPGGEAETLVALVRAYIALSKGQRYEEKRAFWDAEEPQPLLSPEESNAPHIGWPAIETYWSHARGSMASLETECWDIEPLLLSPGFALVTFKQRWTAVMSGQGPLTGVPIAATVRVSMAFRKRDGRWRIFMSVESHVDGATYFRALYARHGEG
jgi:hypothetical protein